MLLYRLDMRHVARLQGLQPPGRRNMKKTQEVRVGHLWSSLEICSASYPGAPDSRATRVLNLPRAFLRRRRSPATSTRKKIIERRHNEDERSGMGLTPLLAFEPREIWEEVPADDVLERLYVLLFRQHLALPLPRQQPRGRGRHGATLIFSSGSSLLSAAQPGGHDVVGCGVGHTSKGRRGRVWTRHGGASGFGTADTRA